jgi:hypothetical protein
VRFNQRLATLIGVHTIPRQDRETTLRSRRASLASHRATPHPLELLGVNDAWGEVGLRGDVIGIRDRRFREDRRASRAMGVSVVMATISVHLDGACFVPVIADLRVPPDWLVRKVVMPSHLEIPHTQFVPQLTILPIRSSGVCPGMT